MERKALLSFHEPDGRVSFETLGPSGDFVELVDPEDCSVRHTGPFAFHGRHWRVARVALDDGLIRIECVAASGSFAPRRAAPRVPVEATEARRRGGR